MQRQAYMPDPGVAEFSFVSVELAAELAALAGHAGTLNCLERPHGGYAQYAVFHRGLAG